MIKMIKMMVTIKNDQKRIMMVIVVKDIKQQRQEI